MADPHQSLRVRATSCPALPRVGRAQTVEVRTCHPSWLCPPKPPRLGSVSLLTQIIAQSQRRWPSILNANPTVPSAILNKVSASCPWARDQQ